MRYVDANCRIGRFNRWSGREPITRDALLETMDHYGIHEALVTASLANEYHPADGNEQVLRLTGGHLRLHPAWVGLPPRSGELPPPQDFVAEMDARGIRALFLYPNQHHFPLESWCVDGLLGPLAERRVPVFICPTPFPAEAQDQADWPGIVRLCRAFPELPVVLAEIRISYTLRPMDAALDACPNLHIDISALWLHHMIEFICREWGASRLLFGSGLPARDPGAVLGQLNYADISPDNLATIAGENLRRLLSWSKRSPLPEPDVRFPDPLDELHAIARNRTPLKGQRFQCAHGHIGRHFLLHIPDASPRQLVAEMDRLGVERGIVFSNAGLNSDEVYGNDLVAAAVQEYPDRFIGFVTANVNRTADEIRRELDRGFAMGMKGIKIHPYLSGYDTNGPNVEWVCAYANERRTFVINHDWGDTERILYLCRKYPDACFMSGHTSWPTIEAVRQVGNLYIGSCPLLEYAITERLVQVIGADRLVFGSDLSWGPIGWGLGPVLYAKIPLDAKRLILGGNLQRLLQQYNR